MVASVVAYLAVTALTWTPERELKRHPVGNAAASTNSTPKLPPGSSAAFITSFEPRFHEAMQGTGSSWTAEPHGDDEVLIKYNLPELMTEAQAKEIATTVVRSWLGSAPAGMTVSVYVYSPAGNRLAHDWDMRMG